MEINTINIQSLSVHYGSTKAVNNVSLDIQRQKITSLIGASGSGKSTILRSLNRMLDETAGAVATGKIFFEGEDILEPRVDVIELRKKIGMVFQSPTPFPKSIYENIAYGLEVQGRIKKENTNWFRRRTRAHLAAKKIIHSADPIDVAVVQSLHEAALWDEAKDRLHQSAFQLSGGQQQRLCIARAIAVRPSVLLLDEPCSELDPISTKKIEDLLLRLKQSYTIVIVTHNMHQARRISDKTAFFHLGRLVEYGETAQIFERPDQEITRDYVMGNFG